MKKLMLVLAVLSLSGCYALKPVSLVADQVCEERTPAENDLLAEKVDAATFPHTVRVQCYAQVKGNE